MTIKKQSEAACDENRKAGEQPRAADKLRPKWKKLQFLSLGLFSQWKHSVDEEENEEKKVQQLKHLLSDACSFSELISSSFFGFLCFPFGGESWWAQCATRKHNKLHMLCSFMFVAHKRPFGVPGTDLDRFFHLGFLELLTSAFDVLNLHYVDGNAEVVLLRQKEHAAE